MAKKDNTLNNGTEEQGVNTEANTNDSSSSVVTMKGVSGKTITSKVKVFKPNKKKSGEAKESKEEIVDKAVNNSPAKNTVQPSSFSAQNFTPRKLPKKVDAKNGARIEPEKKIEHISSVKSQIETVAKTARKNVQASKVDQQHTKAEPRNVSAKPKVNAYEDKSEQAKPVSPVLNSFVPRKIFSQAAQDAAKEAKKQAVLEAENKKIQEQEQFANVHTTSQNSATSSAVNKKSQATSVAMPRKLGNIFSDSNNATGPKKIEKSSLAATARAFAKQSTARAERKNSKDSYGGGGRTNSRNANKGFADKPYNPFDKDKDSEDNSNQRFKKAPRKKTSVAPVDVFATKPSRGFAPKSSFSRNKNYNKDDRSAFRKKEDINPFSDPNFRMRRRGNKNQKQADNPNVVIAKLTKVSLPEFITVKEFSEAIKKTSAEVIKALMKFGEMATQNQTIDFDTASIIANEFGIKTTKIIEVTEEDILFDDSDDKPEDLTTRPPVVAVMGHVDHGKTSLLDYIRDSRVASGEAGGITQHIGAYMVRVNDRKITFLDTPGHEAFTTMRARGAQATDIAILVVAADDGVMPQTIEAINHAKAANTTIVVAINKIDKEGCNIDRVKQELANHDVICEDWGGSTVMVPVSAQTGEGIDELLDMLLLTADMLDLKANSNRQAKGVIIEAKLDKHKGPLATLLIQRGTLNQGDSIVTGSIVGNIRAMLDAKGRPIKKALPSVPVEILGLPEVPEAGELFYAVADEKVARQLAEKRRIQQRESSIHKSSRMSLDNLFAQMSLGEVQDLNIIVKADVVGSVEAVRQSLEKLSTDEVKVRVIHQAVGAINESDIRLAEVSNAIVIGFNVRPVGNAAELAKDIGVDIRLYRVIYSAIEDIEKAIKGMLAPEFVEEVVGHVELREIYKVSGVGTIGGAYVTDGKIMRNSSVRLIRDGIVITECKLASLRRFKDDVKEVAAGYECGVSLENYNDIKLGDVVEVFEMKEVSRA